LDFRPDLSWEFLSEDEITAKSVRALRNHIRHVKEVSAYYRTALGEVAPDEILSPDDFARLPFTTRKNLAETPPQFLGVPPARIVETVITAGTGGRPLPFVCTASDLDRATFSTALSFHAMGITNADRAVLLVSLDRFSLDGMALYRGALSIGVNCMRLGVGVSAHAMVQRYLQFFKPTVLIGTPSVLQAVALEAGKHGFDTSKSPVEKLVCIGEGLRNRDHQLNAVGRTIEARWGAKAFSLYSSTELSVAYGECSARSGCHAHPELVYTEIVDDGGKPLPDGEVGELVATPLGVEGVPLVRYRTGDMTFKLPGSCTCGRNSRRIGPILGRRSQTFTCKGTVIYPFALTNALDAIDDIKDYLVIIEKDDHQSDAVTIQAAVPPAALEKIAQAIREATGVHIPVLVSNIPTIQGLRGGTARKISILDNRGKMTPKAG
jgi:phenylacetate-CoA ligase